VARIQGILFYRNSYKSPDNNLGECKCRYYMSVTPPLGGLIILYTPLSILSIEKLTQMKKKVLDKIVNHAII
jgi:hypothetical protein